MEGPCRGTRYKRHSLWGPPPLRLWSAAPTHGPLRQPRRRRAQGVLTCDAAFSEPRRSGCQRKRSEGDTACAEWWPPGLRPHRPPAQQPREPCLQPGSSPPLVRSVPGGEKGHHLSLYNQKAQPRSRSSVGLSSAKAARGQQRATSQPPDCLWLVLLLGQLSLRPQGQAPWPCSPPCGAQPGSPTGFSGLGSLGRSCSSVCIWPVGPKSPCPGQFPGN